ncbi:MAG TPA: alpha/beta fold hydrolase [Chloroflexia bacterium]|nr:alpha/beta fold hydrolase [Chloroflexia bacterium]
MTINVDLYRRNLNLPPVQRGKVPLTLSAIDAGPRDALRTIVFIHGFGGRAAYWHYQLEHFSDENRVIALDLRGHGLSDAPQSRYTVEELVEDVEQALKALNVPEKFILVAHSFGGAVSAYFMHKNPGRVEKLVLIASAVRFNLRWTGRALLKAPTPLLRLIRQTVPVARIYPPAHVVKNWNLNALTTWDGTDYLKKIKVPALVILGQRDLLFRQEAYKEVATLIPGASEVIIPVSAHQVMVERPDAVNRAIERFIGPPPRREEQAKRRQERQKLERERPWLKFYDSRTPYKIDPPVGPVQRSLEVAARRYANRPALIFYDRAISYRQLDKLADRFAHGLQRVGLKPGERVLILLPNTPQAVIAYYGVLKAGGVTVFCNPLFTQEELLKQLKDCGASYVVCLSLFYPTVKAVAEEAGLKKIIVSSFKDYMGIKDRLLFRLLREKQEGHKMPPTQAHGKLQIYSFAAIIRRGAILTPDSVSANGDLAVIQYTSGTTGTPSGIMLTHANLVSNALQVRHWIAEARPGEEIILAALPFSHSYGLTGCINLAPLLGATLVLLPNFVTHEALEAIARYRPTIFPGVPQMYINIANFPGVRKYGISSVRVCVSGGAPLALEVQEAFEKLTRGRLVEGYGLTEAGPVTHSNPLSGRRRTSSIGLPLPDTEAKIVDIESGADLPPGMAGELLVRGPQVMQGYWNRPEETARALEGGWLHTGDIARMDEDGYFYIIDRKKDLIMAGNYNVYPRDIEEVLYEHPKVLDVAVVGVPPTGEKRRVKAYVVLRPGERATAEELLELCRQRLESYAVPATIEFLPELPRNFVGKVLRRLLVEQDAEIS